MEIALSIEETLPTGKLRPFFGSNHECGSRQLLSSPREVARWQKAQEHLLGGRHAVALELYRKLARDYPGIAELWFELGNSALGELDFTTANEGFSRACEKAGENSALLALIGQQYQTLRQQDDARRCYERAAAVAPASIDARINLAVWLEKERRLDEAWDETEAALEIDPRDDQARYFRAFLLHRQQRNEEAAAELNDLIQSGPRYPYVKYASRHLLGVVCDHLGDFDEAMRWLLEAKQEVRTLADTKVLERATTREPASGTGSWTPSSRIPSAAGARNCRGIPAGHSSLFWADTPAAGPPCWEQVLGAHPSLLAFDEPVASTRRSPGGFNWLRPKVRPFSGTRPTPAPADRRDAAALHEEPAPRGGRPGGVRVLLDKNPSPTASLGIWLRIFPAMKVVIALRDPRDVIVSCFFMNVMLNSTNVNFLSLERTVKHYRDLMDVWLRLREFGGFDWIESRYEDLVADFEQEGKRVTGFLAWDGMRGNRAFTRVPGESCSTRRPTRT